MEKINRVVEALRRETVNQKRLAKLNSHPAYSIGKEFNRERDEIIKGLVHREVSRSLQNILNTIEGK